jgi:hypothetical protein
MIKGMVVDSPRKETLAIATNGKTKLLSTQLRHKPNMYSPKHFTAPAEGYGRLGVAQFRTYLLFSDVTVVGHKTM